MHKSRLAGFIIDCNTDDLETAAGFWCSALGLQRGPSDGRYITMQTAPGDPHIEVQRVSHESRVHLDIEADDTAAEVRRLELLGARKIGAVNDWYVMEAPTGQRFCIVPAASADFEEQANTWDSPAR